MAQLNEAANTPENSETSGFSVIPEGTYLAQIVSSQWKDTKAGDGKYINFHLKIAEGEYAGRMVFDNLNLVNKNPIAVDIAKRTLNSICQAVGETNVEDTEELHGKLMEIKIKIREGGPDWPDQNEVVAYLPADEEDTTRPWE